MTLHPMASFPRLKTARYFPTVHIHDGTVSKAQFDHSLFCQPTREERPKIRDGKSQRGIREVSSKSTR
jgi:hypothetical protein